MFYKLLLSLSFGLLSTSAQAAVNSSEIAVINHPCGQSYQQMQQQLNFACLGYIESGGSIGSEYNSSAGYDLSRSWQAGVHLSEVLKLGDLAEEFSPQNFTVGQLISSGGGDYSSLTIGDFPLVRQQKLGDLVQVLPNLPNLPLSQFPGLESFHPGASSGGIGWQSNHVHTGTSFTLGDALELYPELNGTRLQDLDIDDSALSEIPGLQSLELLALPGWANQYLADVPSFTTIPLVEMPNPLAVGGTQMIARVDALRKLEGTQRRTMSGSYQEGFRVPCQGNCDYVELDDLENQGDTVSSSYEGVRWISGKNQKVQGGEGCLAGINGGQEPTGRHPFGSALKVVVWDVDPVHETLSTKLFLRIKSACGATPYFIGPVSFLTHHRDDLIMTGFDVKEAGVERQEAGGGKLEEDSDLSQFLFALKGEESCTDLGGRDGGNSLKGALANGEETSPSVAPLLSATCHLPSEAEASVSHPLTEAAPRTPQLNQGVKEAGASVNVLRAPLKADVFTNPDSLDLAPPVAPPPPKETDEGQNGHNGLILSQTPTHPFSPSQSSSSWDFWTFAQSVPQQSYTAFSDYLCNSEGECGFRLGVYRLNSTDSTVRAALSDSEAQGWLGQLNQGTGNQRGAIDQYFSKTTQEQIFRQQLDGLSEQVATQFDPMTGQPFQEMRQVQRIAQAYIGGTGSKIDGLIPVGLGGDSLLLRSRNLVNIYGSRS